MRSEHEQKTLHWAGQWSQGALGKAFLEFFFHWRTLHKCVLDKKNKWTMFAVRLRQFKHRPILKTAKGHAEGGLAWVSGRRKYFFSILAPISTGQWHLDFCLLSHSLLMIFFSLKTQISDREKKQKNYVWNQCNHTLKGNMWNVL